MKPRTKFEKEVAQINATLSEDIAATDAEFAKHLFDEPVKGNQVLYFTIAEQYMGCEVKRLYRIHKFNYKRHSCFAIYELVRKFFRDGKELIFAKQRTMGCYYDSFSYKSDIELRSNTHNMYGYCLGDLFTLSQESKMRDEGERIMCDNVNPADLKRLMRYPYCETMYKNKENWLFMYLLQCANKEEVIRSIIIAKRHGFVFTEENASLWFDMVNAMLFVGKDNHNPVYVAPADLLATHNRFINMQERNRRRIWEQRRRAMADEQREKEAKLDALYIKNRKRFFGLVITDGEIECRVLPNVDAFRAEADYMHHCVYACGYWNMISHKYSLILSARINGQRIETIEVNLHDFKIMQSYGKYDHFTDYHQRILDLVNGSMDMIKAYDSKQLKKAA